MKNKDIKSAQQNETQFFSNHQVNTRVRMVCFLLFVCACDVGSCIAHAMFFFLFFVVVFCLCSIGDAFIARAIIFILLLFFVCLCRRVVSRTQCFGFGWFLFVQSLLTHRSAVSLPQQPAGHGVPLEAAEQSAHPPHSRRHPGAQDEGEGEGGGSALCVCVCVCVCVFVCVHIHTYGERHMCVCCTCTYIHMERYVWWAS